MARSCVQLSVSTLVLFSCQGAVADDKSCPEVLYTIPKDISVAEEAKQRSSEWCEGGFKGEVDSDEGHAKLLQNIGHENRIYKLLNESYSPSELLKNAENQMEDLPWLIQISAAIIVSFIVAFVWLICCWTCCPFCQCCRCFRKERTTSNCAKIIGVLFMLGLGIGVCATALLAQGGATKTVDGLHNFACTSASFLDSILGGQEDPHFIGVNSMQNKFHLMDKSLEEGSSFMTQAELLLQETVPLTAALAEASETLKLMKDTLLLNDNLSPQPDVYFETRRVHQCELCLELQDPLSEVESILDNSFTGTLARARSEVMTQFQPGRRADLQCDLRSAAKPVKEVIDMVRDHVEWFIDDESFGKVSANRMTLLLVLVAAIVLGALVLACASSSAVCFLLKEKRDTDTGNPYNFWVYRTAGASWCCGFGYAFAFFLLGGILVAFTVPLSGLCLVMEDIDSTKFEEMHRALGLVDPTMAPGTKNWMMATEVIDQCLSPVHYNASGNIMDIMFIDEQGAEVTMHDRLTSSLVEPLDEKFKQIDQVDMSNSVKEGAAVAKLVKIFRDNPVSSFIVPNSLMRQSWAYKGLATDDRGEAGIAVGYMTSASCKNHTVASNMEPLTAGKTQIGMETFVSRLSKYGQTTGGSSCLPEKITCNSDQPQGVCVAINNFLHIQRRMTAADNNNFRCDIFTKPDGDEDCDPAESVMNADGSWIGSCANTTCLDPKQAHTCTTTLKRKAKRCNLEEFQQYVERYEMWILNSIGRVESTTAMLEKKITVDLRDLVEVQFQQPINSLVDGTSCGFLNQMYKDMVASLCYQGAWGILSLGQSYIAMAVLIFFMIPLAYAIWRRALDNANEWGKDKISGV